MRYWWVNHKQTSKHEVSGGFLWSPKYKKDGSRNQFYDNMRIATPGDLVISYADMKICHVGVITDFAMPAPMPSVFVIVGERWERRQGWMLAVEWKKMPEPIKPASKIEEFSRFLPKKYSPLNPNTGYGRENAYLAEVVKEIFDVLIGAFEISLAGLETSKVSDLQVIHDIDKSIEDMILLNDELDSTVRLAVSEARRGQGVFKKNILDFESACRLTGISNPKLLIASHIKPWRLCNTAAERLSGANGLLLTPHADFLFDRGFISFKDSGEVIISSALDALDFRRLGFNYFPDGKVFHESQRSFLAFHRENVLLV